jgi:hypothetical protein
MNQSGDVRMGNTHLTITGIVPIVKPKHMLTAQPKLSC